MGFIGIDRGLRDHWIYQDAEYLKVWMEMLFLARFSEEPHIELIDGDIITVSYGQFIFGRVKWSQRLKVGEQRLRTLITKLKKAKMIAVVDTHRKCSVYEILNYAKFNHESNHQSSLTQQGIEVHANHQTNQQLTISQPSVNHQSTTKEQGSNKVNKDNKDNKKIKYTEFVRLLPEEYEKLINEYGEEMTKECIDILNTYKGSTGKTYKSDYMTLTPKAWVAQRYRENQAKKIKQFPVKGGKPNARHGTGHGGRTDAELDALSL